MDATVLERIAQQMDSGADNPEVEQEPAAELETEETQDIESKEADAVETKDIESEEVESEAETESDDDVWTPQTFDELAEGLGSDLDALKAIKVKTKIDGIEGEATIADLVKNYQIDKSLTNKSEALARQRKEFESQSQEKLQAFNQRLNEVNTLAEALEGQLQNEVQSINWAELRNDDPAEYAARRQEYLERATSLQAMKQQAAQKQQEFYQEQQRETQEKFLKLVQNEQNALVEAIPEWRDEKAFDQGKAELREYMLNRGFSEQEVGSIWDHRHVLLIRDAMKYRQMQEKAEPVKKMAKVKPKFVKPGARQGKAEADQKLKNQKRNMLKKTGSLKDAASLLLDRM